MSLWFVVLVPLLAAVGPAGDSWSERELSRRRILDRFVSKGASS
jgi:hypothetical protein